MEYAYINPEYLVMVTGGDAEMMSELVEMFASQVLEMHPEMTRLLAEGNHKALGQLAHKAKSSVAIMGMEELAGLLKQFELQAKEGQETDRYPEYIERFRSDTANAVAELRILTKSKSGT